MASRAETYGLTWDFVIPKSLTGTQRWVLSAMQDYGGELVNMLWRILGNEQDVCDTYQDTFLKLAHYRQGQKPNHVKAYLFRTAANTAMTILRRKVRQRKFTQSYEPKIINSENELNTKELRQKLRLCIAQLPEHLRDVVALRDLAELSYNTVGQILQITPATARVYRHKAVKLLSVWMNRKEEQL